MWISHSQFLIPSLTIDRVVLFFQVESRYGQRPAKPGADDVRTDDGILRKSPWNELLEAESTGNIMHKVLDSNVGHISTVRSDTFFFLKIDIFYQV